MYFYEVLQKIMDEKDLSIPDVSRLTGLADSTIRSIITRKSKSVALEVAFKLSKGLNVSLEQLNGEDTTEPFFVNENEKRLIISYRNHSDLQPAINKLLEIHNFSEN